MAKHLRCFGEVIETDENHNLKGRHKLKAAEDKFGRDLIYAGDSAADLPIWKAAKGAVLVGTSPGVAETVRRDTPVELELTSEGIGLGTWARALRLHPWFKNLLVFVPLLTAFSFLALVD